MAQLTEDEKTIGRQLVKLCLLVGMYRQEFATKLGIQSGNLNNILNGQTAPTTRILYKVKKRFPTLSMEWLLFDKGEPFMDNKVPKLITHFNKDTEQNKYATFRASWLNEAQRVVGTTYFKQLKISVPKAAPTVAQPRRR